MTYLLITKPNLFRVLNSTGNPFRVYSLFRNASGKMTQKISQNKTYVAVNVPGEANANNSRKLFGIFKRNASGVKKEVQGEKKSEYARLFSLAKPEKWNLLGKTKCSDMFTRKSKHCVFFFCRGNCSADSLEYSNNGNTI